MRGKAKIPTKTPTFYANTIECKGDIPKSSLQTECLAKQDVFSKDRQRCLTSWTLRCPLRDFKQKCHHDQKLMTKPSFNMPVQIAETKFADTTPDHMHHNFREYPY